MNALSALQLAARLIDDAVAHRLDVIRYKSNKIEWSHEKNCFPPPELSVLSVDYGSAFSLNLPECGQREKIQRQNVIQNLSAEWCFEASENGEIKRNMLCFHFISRNKNHRAFFNYIEDYMRKYIRKHYKSKIDEQKVVIVLDNCSRKWCEIHILCNEFIHTKLFEQNIDHIDFSPLISDQKNKHFISALKFTSFPRQIFFKVSKHSKSRIGIGLSKSFLISFFI